MNRVKIKKPDTKNLCWDGCQPRVKLCKENKQKYGHQSKNVFKIECCGSYCQLPTEKTK
jgi:hypothetical protein